MEYRHPALKPGQIDAPHEFAALGDLQLESGEVIHDYYQSYVTHGQLNQDRSNAVLFCSAISANHHRLDFLIGAGRAFDPRDWFIIATDAIGNGLSTSPSNSQCQPGMKFPRFSIRDMVHSQYRLVTEHLHLDQLAAVVGASMGGMQALQWGVRWPKWMRSLIALTPMARTTPWSVAVNETTRQCLMADPAWTGNGFSGVPERGWRAWVNIQHLLINRTPRGVMEDFADSASILEWLHTRQQQWLADGFDAIDWLYQTWAYDSHDVGTTFGFAGDTEKALRSIRARSLIMTPLLDLYNPAEAGREAAAAIPGAFHVEIPSWQGHQAANIAREADVRFVNQTISSFLHGN